MPHRKPPHENPAKAAESVEPESGLEKFKSLTRGLLGVPRDELADAEARYQREKALRQK